MSIKIKKVLNSSVVLVKRENGDELIALGKGIGYGKKPGMSVPDEAINQWFVPIENINITQIEDLLDGISDQIIDISRQIVQYAEKTINGKLNKTLLFSLMDHINFSLERLSKNMSFKNKLYYEVENYYPDEFKVGEFAVKLINNEMNVELPKEEAASIAFHIINSEESFGDSYDSMRVTQMISDFIRIITNSTGTKLNKKTISYQRLLTHLKFFSERIALGTQLHSDDSTMFEYVTKQYPDAMKIALKILKFLDKSYHIKVTNEELMYLIIHIQRNIDLKK